MGKSGRINGLPPKKMSAQEKCIYVGEFRHNFDAKNRLTVPSKWRFLGDEADVYLALPNPIGCVTVYPPKMVEKLKGKVEEVSLGDKTGQRALMKLFSKADSFGCDKQGRIHLSDNLFAHGGFKKEALLVGNFVTFSLWNLERYEAYMERPEEGEDEMTQILRGLGV